MAAKALAEIEASIDELDLRDQIRLLQYLTPKVATAVLTSIASDRVGPDDEAWRRYRKLGDQLAATSTPGAASLTQAVCEARR